MNFKEWMTKNEGLTEPPQERPDQLGKADAKLGVGAYPTYSLPGEDPLPGNKVMMKKRMKKKQKKG